MILTGFYLRTTAVLYSMIYNLLNSIIMFFFTVDRIWDTFRHRGIKIVWETEKGWKGSETEETFRVFKVIQTKIINERRRYKKTLSNDKT